MKIGIAGYTGRVGQILVAELLTKKWDGLELACGSTRSIHPEHVPSDFFPIVTTPNELASYSDCIIDFTTPEATIKNLEAAIANKTAIIVGTTGLGHDGNEMIHKAAQHIPVVYSANMSIGVNILTALVEQAASRLGPQWDIEIFEAHHKNKVDAPSGTALALGKAAQIGRGGGDFVTNRNGRRKEGDIGYAVSRGGDVVGEHMVTFYGMGERIELGHKASDRSLFAKGALQAAQWIGGKPAGLYSMRDVLGL